MGEIPLPQCGESWRLALNRNDPRLPIRLPRGAPGVNRRLERGAGYLPGTGARLALANATPKGWHQMTTDRYAVRSNPGGSG